MWKMLLNLLIDFLLSLTKNETIKEKEKIVESLINLQKDKQFEFEKAKKDLDILKDYLILEELQFEVGKFKYEIYVDKDLDVENTIIPPMIFQVLTENSIIHGLKDKTIGGNLIIKVEKKRDIIKCIVEDNGIGREASRQFNLKEGKEKTSIGSGLAERLIKLSSKSRLMTTYEIIDLFDSNDNPS